MSTSPRTPVSPRSGSSLGLLGRGAVWVAMLASQLVFLGRAQLAGETWLLLLPLPAFAIAVFGLRPAARRPEGVEAGDWGWTLGHSWVRLGHRVYWVPDEELLERSAEPEPASPEWTHAGFELEVLPGHGGMPSIPYLAGGVLAALVVPYPFVIFGSILVSPELSDPTLLLFGTVFGTLCATIGIGMLLAPWVALLWAWEEARAHRGSTRVELVGRTVRVSRALEEGSFTLGAPDQQIVQDGGTLTLKNGKQQRVIRGMASDLAFLREAFEAVSRDGGDAEAIPAALARLRSETTA